MQQPVGLGHRDRSERPLCTRADIEAFLAPPANQALVYITQPDSPENWQQVVAQEALVQLDRPHLKHTILQPLFCIVAEKHARLLRINPVTSADLGFLECQPADRLCLPGERMWCRPKPSIWRPIASLVTTRLTPTNVAEVPPRPGHQATLPRLPGLVGSTSPDAMNSRRADSGMRT